MDTIADEPGSGCTCHTPAPGCCTAIHVSLSAGSWKTMKPGRSSGAVDVCGTLMPAPCGPLSVTCGAAVEPFSSTSVGPLVSVSVRPCPTALAAAPRSSVFHGPTEQPSNIGSNECVAHV